MSRGYVSLLTYTPNCESLELRVSSYRDGPRVSDERSLVDSTASQLAADPGQERVAPLASSLKLESGDEGRR
jgi:hypothetical protein